MNIINITGYIILIFWLLFGPFGDLIRKKSHNVRSLFIIIIQFIATLVVLKEISPYFESQEGLRNFQNEVSLWGKYVLILFFIVEIINLYIVKPKLPE